MKLSERKDSITPQLKTVKSIILTAIRIVAVTVLYFVTFVVVSGALLSTAAPQPAPEEAASALLALFVVSIISAAVWSYVLLRSRWAGWKLIVSMIVVFYGVNTLMPQIETAYFVTRLPPGMLPRLFIAGAIMAVIFVPLAVLILGKRRSQTNEPRSRVKIPPVTLMAKLSLIVIAYVIIYFTFGYFVAWRSPAVREFYGGGELTGFISQITTVLRDEPLLFLLQAVRALLWTACAVPVIRMMKGEWWEAGLDVALLFAVTSAQLLLPNPLMPPEVRMAHLLETVTSNFLFGWLVVWILRSIRNEH